jgi:hypothetical protein
VRVAVVTAWSARAITGSREIGSEDMAGVPAERRAPS